MVADLQAAQQARLRDLGDVLVEDDEPCVSCPRCAGPMRVRKTFRHRGVTLAHGRFRVRETERVCAAGCTQKAGGAAQPRPLVRRASGPARLLLPRSTIGYDVMAHIGVERFVHFRQREDIRRDLLARCGIQISAGEVSSLARKFCVYLKALHMSRAKPLRAALAADGGWPMHIDATGEDGRGTLLVIYAGWRHWVLGSWKIPTENAQAILPRMRETAQLFGPPCAVMRDLGRAVIDAARTYIASLAKPIPNLGCHMHFVRDVGKDLLHESYDALRGLFRRFGIVAHVRTLVRDLGRRLGGDLDEARGQMEAWLSSGAHPYCLPPGQVGLAMVRAVGQWTLDWVDDGNDEGFPFDRPWLDLYQRCLIACRATEAFLTRQDGDRPARRALRQLFDILVTVRSQLPFGRHATVMVRRAKLLDDLRGALRLTLKPDGRNAPLPSVLSARQAARELQDIKAAVKRLASSLRRQRPDRGPAADRRAAIDLVLAHLGRHGPSLFGHLIRLPRSVGGGLRIVERTNVLLEHFFHILKRGERHRSGRKNLARDFEHLPPEAALASNLLCQDYLDIVCSGSLVGLPAAFARLDVGHRDRCLAARLPRAAGTPDAATSSMSTTDRRFVRTEPLTARVYAAAASRALLLD
jgi:hypothetical protein